MADRRLQGLAASLAGDEASLVDVIDSLVDKGVVLQGDVALGIAGIDLITLKLAALLVSAERLDDAHGQARDADDSTPSAPGRREAGAATDEALDDVDPEPVSASAAGHGRAWSVSSEAPPPMPTARPASAASSPETRAWTSAAAPGAAHTPTGRWDVDPDDVRRSVMKLVLTLVEVIRQLLERRAIRQMDAGRLADAEVERLGRSLHELERTVQELAAQAGLDPAELNLELGPLGRLL